MERPVHISVIGAGRAEHKALEMARQVGAALARSGSVLVCGGLGGVMEAACRGASEVGGRTVGVLPGSDPGAANSWAEVVIPTGLGHARNVLVVQAGEAVVALPGSHGTRSELALALKVGRPVVALGAWLDVEGVVPAKDAVAAVAAAVGLARERRGR